MLSHVSGLELSSILKTQPLPPTPSCNIPTSIPAVIEVTSQQDPTAHQLLTLDSKQPVPGAGCGKEQAPEKVLEG